MVEQDDIIRLKSGGPDMVVTYVLAGEGTREKVSALRGFQEGDVACEWQQTLPDGSTKTVRDMFKAATVMFLDGTPVGDDD